MIALLVYSWDFCSFRAAHFDHRFDFMPTSLTIMCVFINLFFRLLLIEKKYPWKYHCPSIWEQICRAVVNEFESIKNQILYRKTNPLGNSVSYSPLKQQQPSWMAKVSIVFREELLVCLHSISFLLASGTKLCLCQYKDTRFSCMNASDWSGNSTHSGLIEIKLSW